MVAGHGHITMEIEKVPHFHLPAIMVRFDQMKERD
jgi:hypothetical protein